MPEFIDVELESKSSYNLNDFNFFPDSNGFKFYPLLVLNLLFYVLKDA